VKQRRSGFRFEPPRDNSRIVGKPETIKKRASRRSEH
jgi:hypothetical protein